MKTLDVQALHKALETFKTSIKTKIAKVKSKKHIIYRLEYNVI
ncbi:transposase [Bacillus licheniformis]|nr:transposase [Bacillus licheniformis]